MKTSLFDFELPAERIASHPTTPRDAARMLVVDKQNFIDANILDLPDFLNEGDVMVFNNTRVIPARLHGKRGDANIEITLHKNVNGSLWRVFAKPGKKLQTGDTIIFGNNFSGTVKEKYPTGEINLEFICDDLRKCLEQYGSMPLPPYMKREANPDDSKSYQTIYAEHDGAVAAPTAGLHFTDRLFKRLDEKRVRKAFVTLHVGAGTFQPVKADDTSEHKMHSEYAEISQATADIINTAKKAGRRIIAVGTTSLRVLESATDGKDILHSYAGETDIFITPGYEFRIVDALMTNFHLPRSTLFMLVSAFSGLDTMQAAYKHAITNNYRFYSYGDACLLIP